MFMGAILLMNLSRKAAPNALTVSKALRRIIKIKSKRILLLKLPKNQNKFKSIESLSQSAFMQPKIIMQTACAKTVTIRKEELRWRLTAIITKGGYMQRVSVKIVI